MTMTLVETITVGSGGAASIEFTSIPQDADDLVILLSGRNSNTFPAFYLGFNSSTSNFSRRILYGTGSGVASGTGSNNIINGVTRSSDTANTFGNTQIYVPNYSGSSTKSISIEAVIENNATSSWLEISAMLWNDTSAITSVELYLSGHTFSEHSTASLYKITKA